MRNHLITRAREGMVAMADEPKASDRQAYACYLAAAVLVLIMLGVK